MNVTIGFTDSELWLVAKALTDAMRSDAISQQTRERLAPVWRKLAVAFIQMEDSYDSKSPSVPHAYSDSDFISRFWANFPNCE